MNNQQKIENNITKWQALLNGDRMGGSNATKTGHRSKFDEDIDRITPSSSLRRLQDKAQVFPLQENDFTRTRLTHSLEVSGIARSLGLAVQEFLLDRGEIKAEQLNHIPSLLFAAGLVHDLGNPPFGHYGEDIIRSWFDNKFRTNDPLFAELTNEEKEDFISFDGNAQTLRILNKLQFNKDSYGLNLTYGTLSTLIKYPVGSSETTKKKFGYFQDDKDRFEIIRKETGLTKKHRNPLTYLLEAADDIAYIFSDIEDGVKKGLIHWEKEYKRFKLANIHNKILSEHFKFIDKKNEIYVDTKLTNKENYYFQNFKIAFQGKMILDVIETFKNSYDAIMKKDSFSKRTLNKTGKYEELINKSYSKDTYEYLKKLLIDCCFTSNEVISLELSGEKVITSLLDLFVEAILKSDDIFSSNGKTKEEKLLLLVSDNFKHVLEMTTKQSQIPPTTYQKLLLITDFISGMTDSYALNLYKKLIGVKIV